MFRGHYGKKDKSDPPAVKRQETGREVRSGDKRLGGWKAGVRRQASGARSQEAGKQEGGKVGRPEGWEAGRLEGWEAGRREGGEAGRPEG